MSDTVDRMREESKWLKAELQLRAEIERLRAERDEARREVCAYASGRYGKDVVTLDRTATLDEANRRGWDCFKGSGE
jgi:predicted RNase H-like nuclease (RuvC/YqgF family)